MCVTLGPGEKNTRTVTIETVISMSIDIVKACERFEAHFGFEPQLAVRAPGRVNIIGEHTDYNGGFVLPMAIDQETVIVARPRADRHLRAFAANLERTAEAGLEKPERNDKAPWLDYLVGVAAELADMQKPPTGADVMIVGDVPIACGLSSSASLEMAALALFENLDGFTLDGAVAARLGRRVENDFLGLNTGIMDQFISRLGKAGHALFLDCRSLEYEHVPVALEKATFVIGNTCVSRGLAASKYNERVAECKEALSALNRSTGRAAKYLRDFTMDDLEAEKGIMADIPYRRAKHVITENARTLAACEAMRAGDAERLGKLMNESDESLRTDYEVTCEQLDVMTDAARAAPGCYGARMTGAGFGGCTINLVAKEQVQAFCGCLLDSYEKQTGSAGETFISEPAAGAAAVPL